MTEWLEEYQRIRINPRNRAFRGGAAMTKRILVFLSFCTIFSTVGWGQQSCITTSGFSNKLACQIPVITTAATPGTIGNPAAVFSSSFAVQLGQLPILSSGSGVVLSFDKQSQVYVASENLGPILTERAETIGKHKLLLAFAYQHFNFTDISGNSLSAVPFVFAAKAGNVTIPDSNQPCTGTGSIICLTQTDHISMSVNQYTALATFGINGKTDVSVIIPFEYVSQNVSATGNQYFINSSPPVSAPFSSSAPGSANGIGDMLVSVKRAIWSNEKTHLTAGLLVRFPTGEALNYLGSGAYGFDPYGVVSYNFSRFSPHVRLGYQFNTSTVLAPKFDSNGKYIGNSTLPGGFQYDFGADAIVIKKVPTTFAADFLGNYILNAPVLVSGTVAIPGFTPSSAKTLRPTTSSYNSSQLSLGLKVKPYKNLMLYGNVLLQLNNVGLRSAPVPLAGISYTFF
jgi:hypothetical protein